MPGEKVGLKVGLEIHQQLEGKKLFCRCPTLIREEAPDFVLKRNLRAVAGEGGGVDIAAFYEQLKGKDFFYEGYRDTTCLVETDSEPPHDLNLEALYTCRQFCQIVGAKISSVIQVMRKIVVDGSNTAGFQRTALVGREGAIETSEGKVKIENISLEEDACRIIKEENGKVVFRLDRLGIPLIEIGTAPDIKSPAQCLETAKKLGDYLRSLPGVKRGLGTIRQDVNISIQGGSRVEIKGAQELKLLPRLVELEVKRQQELLKIREELGKLKIKPEKLEIVELTGSLKSSQSKIISQTLAGQGKILGISLKGLAGFLKRELQPNYRLGTELAGRARIKAGVGGILHSDELPAYGITAEEVKEIRRRLRAPSKDAFVLVADKEGKARRALEAVYERAKEVFGGVPKEVRKAEEDGTTSFMRPMPGAARMYPETDISLIRPEGKVEVPELREEKVKRFTGWGLGKDLAELVAGSDKVFLFEELVRKYPKIKPAFIAETLTSRLLELKRDYHLEPEKLSRDNFRKLFSYLDEGKIHKDIVIDVLIEMSQGEFKIGKYESLSTEELHKTLKEIVTRNKSAPFSALMGIAVGKLRGKASGEVIAKELKKFLAEGP